MVLANRTRVQNSRTLLRAFGGLNEGYGCSEAEYSAGINFSSRDFPALSTRTPRRKLRTLTGLNGTPGFLRPEAYLYAHALWSAFPLLLPKLTISHYFFDTLQSFFVYGVPNL